MDKRVHTFPKGICPKGNITAQLEFELAYYNPTVQHFYHYTMRTPPENCGCKRLSNTRLGIFRMGQSLIQRVTRNNLNFRRKLHSPAIGGRLLFVKKNRSFLDWLEHTTSHLPVFETCPLGSCNIGNKVSGIFLWPHVWIFFSWY